MTLDFVTWRDSVVASLAARDDVVGVAGLGSTAATERADEFSDLDLFIIVAPGVHDRYRHELDWLPNAEDAVLHLVEWHGGGKVLFRDGRFIEWGVGTPEEVGTWLAGEGVILFDRDGDAAMALASAQANPYPVNVVSEADALATFLFAINQGMGRVRRGELVSGGDIIRSEAVAALLRAARSGLKPATPGALDPIDVRRRVERAFPALASAIAAAVARDPEPAARALLAAARDAFGERLPVGAVEAVSARYGWRIEP
ncbi:MAG: hypothetical protein NVV57_01085 [Demequina sp.]|jgi:hypothetical protein|nr:hypothetical protein [Demequina sp.]